MLHSPPLPEPQPEVSPNMSVPSPAVAVLDQLINEYHEGEEESSAERSARAAGELGLSVLGIGLGELLKGQLAHESDQTRLRAAFECVEQSLARLASTNLKLLARLKSPPVQLLVVLEPVLMLLRKDLPSPAPPPAAHSLINTHESWPHVSSMLSGEGGVTLLQRLHDFPLYALDPELVELLDPYFMSISHAQVRKTAGIVSHLWSWVSAVGVVGDSPYATLPDEKTIGSRRMSTSASQQTVAYARNPLATSPAMLRAPSASLDMALGDGSLPIDEKMQQQLSRLSFSRDVSSPPLIRERRESFSLPHVSPEMRSRSPSIAPALRELEQIRANVDPDHACQWPPVMRARARSISLDRGSITSSHGSPTKCWRMPALADLQPLKFLGAGAFANVFMCRDVQTGQVYALKSILKSLVIRGGKQKQVMAERAALDSAHHPCIISLVATYVDKQHLYLLLEVALGGELFALMSQMGRLDEAQSRFYAASLSLALGHLHSKGYMYRDVKPENLLLTAGGRLKLCDLGIVKKAEHSWTLVGTPEYTAPEVILGLGMTHAVDWWQLGVLVYEMLAAQLPFEAEDGTDASLFKLIARAHYSWPAAEPNDDGSPGRSGEVEDFVAAVLRKALPGQPNVTSGVLMRLGSGPNGTTELMAHPWWDGLDWQALSKGLLPPPFIPQLASDDDDSNFGPLENRGDPVLDSPDYDNDQWDSFFEGW